VNIASTLLLADTWGTDGHMGGGWWIVMMVGMVLFWGSVILGIAWLIRGSVGGWRREERETPMEILERRFAEGRMSADEYHERREVIAGRAGTGRSGSS
jgi:putative membrane protein